MTALRQPLKRHGGKHYLADWIISNFPPRCKTPDKPAIDDPGWLHYVEPYFGGGSVMLRLDPTGISRVANDIDLHLANFWGALRDDNWFPAMLRILEATPVSQREFLSAEETLHRDDSGVEAAVAFFIRCRQSRQGLGRDFATLSRNRTRRGMNEQASAWLSAIDGLPEVHEFLQSVVILNDDALKVIKQQDGPRTLFYLDPPYLHETRESTGEYGDHEMSIEDHHTLLVRLTELRGRFLLSGYPSALYHRFEHDNGWRRVEKRIDNKASSKSEKPQETECLWVNF